MGAAVSIEMEKPVDASDVYCTGSLPTARGEVIRLREKLGHLAKQAGFCDVVYDASDLVLGEKESEDFDRCIAEIVHIRSALKLSTQSSRRQTRTGFSGKYSVPTSYDTKYDDDGKSDASSSDSDSEKSIS
jgi:hypothetical protein